MTGLFTFWPVSINSPSIPNVCRMCEAGVDAMVVVEFVVDTSGRVEPNSIRIVSSPHPGFRIPVVDMLVASTYRPGRMAGRAVRAFVQIPITLRIRR